MKLSINEHEQMSNNHINLIDRNFRLNTMVTISIEDGEISLLRSSTVKSQTNALTWDSLKSLCIYNKQNEYIQPNRNA